MMVVFPDWLLISSSFHSKHEFASCDPLKIVCKSYTGKEKLSDITPVQPKPEETLRSNLLNFSCHRILHF